MTAQSFDHERLDSALDCAAIHDVLVSTKGIRSIAKVSRQVTTTSNAAEPVSQME
jgi:hypothetical protein